MCDGVKEMKLRAKGRPLLALPMAALAEQWAQSHCQRLREALMKKKPGDYFSEQFTGCVTLGELL